MIEDYFEKTYKFDSTGKFVVRLPTKASIVNLIGSLFRAKSMSLKSERRKSNIIRKAYNDFMLEYEQLNHMRRLSSFELNDSSYYIPHHIVSKLNSSTTKYRVVFNASAVDQSGSSLNDHLLIGPTLQPELFDSIIKFRKHKIAFCADITQMYHQILIDPTNRKYQRFFWRYDVNQPINHYELNTVTYGTSLASYLATKCLQVIARSIEISHPVVAETIKTNFYMDDIMSGADSIDAAIQLQQTIHSVLSSYSFNL